MEYISLRFNSHTPDKNPPVNLEQLTQSLAAINVGLESFYESLISQGAQAVHVEWRPPAGGNEKLAALLAWVQAAPSVEYQTSLAGAAPLE